MVKITASGSYVSPVGPGGENAPQRSLLMLVLDAMSARPGGCKLVYGPIADEAGIGSILVEQVQ